MKYTLFAASLGLLLVVAAEAVQAQYSCTTNLGVLTIAAYSGPGGAVIIPDRINNLPVTAIGDFAFEENSSLTSVAIPGGVTIIGAMAFAQCDNLTAITVAPQNAFYSSAGGVLFNYGGTTLIQFPGGLAGSYAIPDGVTSIADDAFYFCILTNVTVPDSVTSIGEEAFFHCDLANNLTIPGSVTHIGGGAFYKNFLTSLTISNGVGSIGGYAFAECFLTNALTIPGSVTSIGDDAFFGCYLPSVAISNGVATVGVDAFGLCLLTNVTIPGSVTNIGEDAFAGCSSLTAITVDAQNTAYRSDNGVLLSSGGTVLQECPEGLAGGYTIPYGVISIGDDAFADCTRLTSVTFPASLTNIGSDPFPGCTHLTSITFASGVTSIGVEAFEGLRSLASVTIPSSLTSIGQFAFAGCNGLTSLYFTGNAPGVDSDAFDGDTTATAYYLPGRTGWTSTLANVPTKPWQPLIAANGVSFGAQSNEFGFTVNWASGQVIAVEACADLTNPVWVPLQTNTLASDLFNFSAPLQTGGSARFYRVRSP